MAADPSPCPSVSIEAFDPAPHDRTAFSCGSPRIDNFLLRTAKKHQKGDFTRVWITREPASPCVRGFHAINAHCLQAEDLPTVLTRRATRHDGIPAVYLSMLGVDRSMQGLGLGRILMACALQRLAATSEHVGVAFMVLDVLDYSDDLAMTKRRRFCERVGFISLPFRPLRMVLPTATIRKLL